jgi:hypothetical protein
MTGRGQQKIREARRESACILFNHFINRIKFYLSSISVRVAEADLPLEIVEAPFIEYSRILSDTYNLDTYC